MQSLCAIDRACRAVEVQEWPYAAGFALPLLGCGVALAIVFAHRPIPEGLLVVSMAALVLCQVGALLAYGYDRSRPGPVPLGH